MGRQWMHGELARMTHIIDALQLCEIPLAPCLFVTRDIRGLHAAFVVEDLVAAFACEQARFTGQEALVAHAQPFFATLIGAGTGLARRCIGHTTSHTFRVDALRSGNITVAEIVTGLTRGM